MLLNNRLYRTTVITGLGRSGTTFLAHVFYNAGFDLGVGPSSIGCNIPDGGFELANVSGIGRQGHFRLLHEYPVIIKDPSFASNLNNWLRLGQIPEHVIFVQRDIDSCFRSHLRFLPGMSKSSLQRSWNKGLDNIRRNGIPFTIVPFPDIAMDHRLSYLLEPWIRDAFPVLSSTFDISKVHF